MQIVSGCLTDGDSVTLLALAGTVLTEADVLIVA